MDQTSLMLRCSICANLPGGQSNCTLARRIAASCDCSDPQQPNQISPQMATTVTPAATALVLRKFARTWRKSSGFFQTGFVTSPRAMTPSYTSLQMFASLLGNPQPEFRLRSALPTL